MSDIDYKALAERLRKHADRLDETREALGVLVGTADDPAADLRTVVSLLNGMAEEKSVAWVEVANAYEGPYSFHGQELLPTGRHSLFTHPAPQPIPEGWQLLKDSTREERSWHEDYEHENGNYSCTCHHCGREFNGHKRRVTCKVCVWSHPAPHPQSLTPTQPTHDPAMGMSLYQDDPQPDLAPDPYPDEPEWEAPVEPTEAQIEASQAALDVLAERRRQVEAEGWTPAHDDKHIGGQMAMAAACYAAHSAVDGCIHCTSEDTLPALAVLLARAQSFVATCWPWSPRWWKPKDRRRNLVKAGALILAEIERLDRAASREQPE